jgi:hypothetical protein
VARQHQVSHAGGRLHCVARPHFCLHQGWLVLQVTQPVGMCNHNLTGCSCWERLQMFSGRKTSRFCPPSFCRYPRDPQAYGPPSESGW